MFKKIIITALALVLAAAMCATAFAGAEISGVKQMTESRDVTLNRWSNTMIYRSEDSSTYALIDAQGNVLTDKPYIAMSTSGAGFVVALEEGLNVQGFINGQGKEMTAMAYGDIVVVDENWQIGVVLETATGENYDYRNFSNDEFFLVTAYDVYYQGARIGTLNRMDYSSANAYGKYLYVTDRNGNGGYYDSAFNKSGYTGNVYTEYVFDSANGVVWHPGSNQQAFCAGCTLTSEDVTNDLYFVGGSCLDLQGNAVFAQGAYQPSGIWRGDYHKVRGFNNLYGLVDRSGNLVLPCEYDAIWEGTYDGFFGSGYQAVVKEGKFGYVDLKGNVTCPFTYSESVVGSASSPVVKVKNMEGNYILLSAAAGELPGSYAYVYTHEGCPLIEVEDADGNKGIIDIWGNEVLPIGENSAINIAHDGSMFTVYAGYHQTDVYSVGYGEAAAVKEAAPAEETAAEETAPAEDGSWTCSCGAVNSGKFCPECGSAKPAEEIACKECGYKPEGDVPNFCPECGTKF